MDTNMTPQEWSCWQLEFYCIRSDHTGAADTSGDVCIQVVHFHHCRNYRHGKGEKFRALRSWMCDSDPESVAQKNTKEAGSTEAELRSASVPQQPDDSCKDCRYLWMFIIGVIKCHVVSCVIHMRVSVNWLNCVVILETFVIFVCHSTIKYSDNKEEHVVKPAIILSNRPDLLVDLQTCWLVYTLNMHPLVESTKPQ